MSSSSSLCVVCPPCVYASPPCEAPCYEGPCSSAPSSGVVVASGTFGNGVTPLLVVSGIGGVVLAALAVTAKGSLVRQSRPRR